MTDSSNTKEIVYAFIDSQNLNLGTSKDIIKNAKKVYIGWKLDMKKFRIYLSDKFRVNKAFLFLGYIPENKQMYNLFKNFGYELIFKPTIKDSKGHVKGNVDAELVLHSARIQYDLFNTSIIVSGDGDFLCLYEFLSKQKKLKSIIIPNKYKASSLLKEFDTYKTFLISERKKLERK
jgi:uncharacterized LabA/DUF88 family protein